jgi:hypothetical protein
MRRPEIDDEELSREWEERFSEQYKKTFWWNKVTRKVTWADPWKQYLREPHRMFYSKNLKN